MLLFALSKTQARSHIGYIHFDKTHLIHRPIDICVTSPLRLIKGKNASRARLRGNLRNHIKRQGRARAREADHSNDHSRGRARGINNISKEPG